jgi:hypothetical protein
MLIRRSAPIAGAAVAVILAACGGPRDLGACEARYIGTATQVDARETWSCIDFGLPEGATWRTTLIGGEVVAYSGDCAPSSSPVFEAYGEQPPGTPSGDECARRYP